MGFADQYVWALGAGTLQDDETHHATEPLFAAAVADVNGAGLGALLTRTKYADGVAHQVFESGPTNLAHLVRVWTARVVEKGREHKWVREGTACAPQAAQGALPPRRQTFVCLLAGRKVPKLLRQWQRIRAPHLRAL